MSIGRVSSVVVIGIGVSLDSGPTVRRGWRCCCFCLIPAVLGFVRAAVGTGRWLR